MSSSLDKFLNEKEAKLVDLDWLDVNQKDYDNLPFNDIPQYIAIPKLEEAWSHREDTNFNLVPNVDLDFKYNRPQENKPNDVLDLLNFTKKQMMSGKTGSDLVEVIKTKATPNLIKEAYDRLKELSLEQGLLGNVYIDASVFSKCEEGSNFVAKRAKTAKYVKAIPKCNDCFYNKKGRCDIYRKFVAKEINYDEDLFNFYSKHFSSLRGKEVNITSKEDIQKEFLAKVVEKPRIAEFKPTTKEKEEKSLEDITENYDKYMEDLKKELSNVKKESVEKEISMLLVKGYSGSVIRDYIKTKYSKEEFTLNKDAFNSVLAFQGSAGEVFMDLDKLPIDTKDQGKLKDFLKDHAQKVKFLVVDPKGQHGKGPDYKKIEDVSRQLNKKIVPTINDIPKHAWKEAFEEYSDIIKNKVGFIFESNPVKGLRLAFIQKELTKTNFKVLKRAEDYNLKATLDTTEYNPQGKNEVYFTPKKISNALDKGYTLSCIINTGKKLGVDENSITLNIKKAFENISSVHKYQVDVPVTLPKNVKVVVSQKDVSSDLDKPLSEIHEFSFNSSKAPVDSMVSDFGLKESSITIEDSEKQSYEVDLKSLSFDLD